MKCHQRHRASQGGGSPAIGDSLRADDEVRPAQFGSAEGDPDVEIFAIARAIITQRSGNFEPSACRDRYQEALRGLIETKLKGLPIKPREVITPPPIIDLMAALKRSLAQATSATGSTTAKQKRAKPIANRRQRSLLLPVAGGRKKKQEPKIGPAGVVMRPRKISLSAAIKAACESGYCGSFGHPETASAFNAGDVNYQLDFSLQFAEKWPDMGDNGGIRCAQR